jgi:DNA-binding transcriptional ArsR family regulator
MAEPPRALRDHRLNGEADIPLIASLVADDARAAMLLALLREGSALSTSQLAARARVGLPAASAHLARLTGGGLVTCQRQGRSRMYRLAGPEVARVLEALGAIAPIREVRTLDERSRLDALRTARTCYDHLAGRLGVAVFDALVTRRALEPLAVVAPGGRRVRSGLGPVELGPRAADVFGALGIELDGTSPPAALACLDWTESRPHLSGPLGAAVCTAWLEQGWLLPRPQARALRITDPGRHALHALLGLDLT